MMPEIKIKLNLEHNEQKPAFPSKNASKKKGERNLINEADFYENKQTNKNKSKGCCWVG